MKEKIVAELKTAYAKLGLSDEAFDGVASLLEKTVTDESEIATAVGGDNVKGLLKTIQGQVDSWKNKYHDKDKELKSYKESHPDKNDDPGKGGQEDEDDPEEPEWAKALRKQNEQILAAQTRREKEEKQKATMAAVLSAAKKDGCTDEKALKLTEKLFSLKDEESDEDAAKRFKDEYNANKTEYFGNGAVPGFGIGQSVESDEKAFKASLAAFAASKGFQKKEE